MWSLLSHCMKKWNGFYNLEHKECLCSRVTDITLNMHVQSILAILPYAIYLSSLPTQQE
jgi:hypothetical protein